MRKIYRLVLAAALSLGMVGALPSANAATGDVGGGEVHGKVFVKAGSKATDPCVIGEGYTFDSVVLSGGFRDSSGTFLGSIQTANVYGANDHCNLVGGTSIGPDGTVSSSSSPATFSGNSPGAGLPGVSGIFYGRFARRGSIVTVLLTVFYKVGASGACQDLGHAGCTQATVNVHANFVPDIQPDGTYSQAYFTGDWNSNTSVLFPPV